MLPRNDNTVGEGFILPGNAGDLRKVFWERRADRPYRSADCHGPQAVLAMTGPALGQRAHWPPAPKRGLWWPHCECGPTEGGGWRNGQDRSLQRVVPGRRAINDRPYRSADCHGPQAVLAMTDTVSTLIQARLQSVTS